MENFKSSVSDPLFRIIGSEAAAMNTGAWVIGGYVRDLVLQRTSKDIDVVVIGDGIELASRVAARLGPAVNVSVFKTFGTAMIHTPEGLEIEFVGARRESYHPDSRKPEVEPGTLEDDQNRRDFTINALAISLNKTDFGTLLDPFDGLADMEVKILRTPLDPDITFSDDPLRMMRAVRFAAQLAFHIHPDTLDAIQRNAERIKIISKERVADEFNKILLSPRPSIGIELMEKSGLLQLVMPEFVALKGAEYVDGRGHKDNYRHTLEVLDKTAEATTNLWLRWAALLHDIAKPVTKKYDAKVGWTFHGHEVVGARMTGQIFKRLKLPLNEKMKYVEKLVALHLRPIALVEDGVTDSAIRRLLFDAGDEIDDLMTLCAADITSRNPNKLKRYRENFVKIKQRLVEVEESDKLRNWQPPVSGQLVMDTFGLKPCKQVGDIKNAIRDAILDCRIGNTYAEAVELMLNEGAKLGLTVVTVPPEPSENPSE
ncbi:MAG: HD domain-containing protein [Bacteroidales bacterium]|nr:HD domain-containing protein [Bacteroidales bacterium]